MKKILLLTLISSMFLYSCKDDGTVTPDPDGGGTAGFKMAQEQKTSGFYFSGNWCGPCGLYGKPALKNMSTKHGDDFVYVACQLNGSGATDPFNNVDANALAGAFGVTGVPTIYTGANGGQFRGTGGGTAMESTLDGLINGDLAMDPIANLDIVSDISDGAIGVTVETEFFEDTDDEYSLGVYLIENKLIDRQYVSGAGWANNTEFNNILRMKLSSNVTGDPLPATAKTKGQIESMTFGDFVQSNWKTENLRVVAVLWVKNSAGQVAAVNATIK